MSEPRVILDGLAYVETLAGMTAGCGSPIGGPMRSSPSGSMANERSWHAALGRTLFILAAEWRGFEEIEAAIADRTGQVLVADAPAPRAGWP